MKISFLKTKEAVKVGHLTGTAFRSDKIDIVFKDGFFFISDGGSISTAVPASNVIQFDIVQAEEQKKALSPLKKKSS